MSDLNVILVFSIRIAQTGKAVILLSIFLAGGAISMAGGAIDVIIVRQ
jgi:hypothetical protein